MPVILTMSFITNLVCRHSIYDVLQNSITNALFPDIVVAQCEVSDSAACCALHEIIAHVTPHCQLNVPYTSLKKVIIMHSIENIFSLWLLRFFQIPK